MTFRLEAPFVTYDRNVCGSSPFAIHFSNVVSLSFLYLFGAFYVRTYLDKKKAKIQ
jgi:hypothetical protein